MNYNADSKQNTDIMNVYQNVGEDEYLILREDEDSQLIQPDTKKYATDIEERKPVKGLVKSTGKMSIGKTSQSNYRSDEDPNFKAFTKSKGPLKSLRPSKGATP